MGELLLDGDRDEYIKQDINIEDEENAVPMKTSLVSG
jgi:hypothetical protein